MGARDRILGWLVGDWQWPYASLFGATLLAVLAPPWFFVAGVPLGLVYLQLPIYMFHQWEEHAGDAFRLHVNRMLGGGRKVLTPLATFWINLLGVWVLDLVALYLAIFVDLSFGLIAIYMPLLNGIGHIVQAIVRRQYNPGLWTSLALFLPVGGWSLSVVSAASHASGIAQACGILAAVAVHVAIIAHVGRRIARLKAQKA